MTTSSQYEKRCQKCGDVRSYPMNVRHCVCGGLLRCTSNKSTRWSQERKAAGLCRCGEPLNGKSLCPKHLAEQIERMRKRYKKHARESSPPTYEALENGCWLPKGAGVSPSPLGYMYFHFGDSRPAAHRYFYKLLKGEIPVGLEPDHLCRNRWCCNPDHLELVTHQVNTQRRANAAISVEHVQLAKWLRHQGLKHTKVSEMVRRKYSAVYRSVNGQTWNNVPHANFQAFRTRIFASVAYNGYYRTLEPLSTLDLPTEVTSE